MVSIYYFPNSSCMIHYCVDEMKQQGVDEVYCLSVNDAFVMRQVYTIYNIEFSSHQ